MRASLGSDSRWEIKPGLPAPAIHTVPHPVDPAIVPQPFREDLQEQPFARLPNRSPSVSAHPRFGPGRVGKMAPHDGPVDGREPVHQDAAVFGPVPLGVEVGRPVFDQHHRRPNAVRERPAGDEVLHHRPAAQHAQVEDHRRTGGTDPFPRRGLTPIAARELPRTSTTGRPGFSARRSWYCRIRRPYSGSRTPGRMSSRTSMAAALSASAVMRKPARAERARAALLPVRRADGRSPRELAQRKPRKEARRHGGPPVASRSAAASTSFARRSENAPAGRRSK